MKFIRMAAGLLGCIAALGSCKDLPTIPPDSCGNGVVEPNAGEDCDRESTRGANTACIKAGAVGQCHFDCSNGHACPSGFGCGTDGVCRAANGQLAPLGATLSALGDEASLEDFDGDGLRDLRISSLSDTRIYYSEKNGTPTRGPEIPLGASRAAAGRLSSDAIDDLVFGVGATTAVFLGGTDRQLTPVTYPTAPLPNDPLIGLALELDPTSPGLEVVALKPGPGGKALLVRPGLDLQEALLIPFDKPFTSVAGRPIAIEAHNGLPCSELAIAFQDEPFIRVIGLCDAAGATSPKELARVPLAGCAGAIDIMTGDPDDNGFGDLLADCSEGEFAIAFGAGAGAFGSKPPPAAPDGSSTHFQLKSRGFAIRVLAFGALTEGDTVPDTVLPTAILLDSGPQTPDGGADTTDVITPSGSVIWSEAKIVDINGDGHRDVIAASDRRIDVFTGTGGRLMASTVYPTNGTPSLLTVGDFDGDQAMDIAYREAGLTGEGDKINVLFGKRFGVPDAPVTIAHLDTVVDMQAGPLSNAFGSTADALADLAVIGKQRGSQFVSIIHGATNRQLFSPITMVASDAKNDQLAAAPFVFAVGKFTLDATGTASHASVLAAALSASLADIRLDANNPPLDMRGWLLPLTGDAELPNKGIVVGPAFAEFSKLRADDLRLDGSVVSLRAVDLGGTPAGLDEALMLVPQTRAQPARLFVQGFDSAGGKSSFKAPAAVQQFTPGTEFRTKPQFKLADFDADGDQDVLVLGVIDAKPQLRVLRNDQTGSLDATKFVGVTGLPADAEPTSFATLNLDDDAKLEIAIATTKGFFVARLDAAGGSYVASPATLAGASDFGSVTAMVGGDLTGDGVDDLVIVSRGGTQIFRGEAVHP